MKKCESIAGRKALETYWRTLNENLSKTDPTAFYPDDINIEELL